LKISNKGVLSFATGQTFPGTGKGTVTNVGLSVPTSDFTVTGSPVTTSGTLALQWTVPPDSNDTANAIVKRDADGSFTAYYISAEGGIVGTGVEGLTPTAIGVEAENIASFSPSDANATLRAISFSSVPEFVLYAESDSGSAYVRTDNLGDLVATGGITGAVKNFRIDHPLDPTGKYLIHSDVESPEMKNLYDGVVVLDDNGEATVQMPDYFEALNQDFRYQLTAIRASGPNLYIAQEISGNQFRIGGGKPGAKVSWQVTGIRHDAWANANRTPVEVEKSGKEKGRYLHPKAFGAPNEMSTDYNGELAARNPLTPRKAGRQPEGINAISQPGAVFSDKNP
jgi:hypothetical protein